MWPFHRKPKWVPKVGDRVRFTGWKRITIGSQVWWDDHIYPGTIIEASTDGKHVQIEYDMDGDSGRWRCWREAKDTILLQAADHPSKLDARVVEELTALECEVGGTEGLLDLLRSIRAGYEEKVG
jgi:hypothetical protein